MKLGFACLSLLLAFLGTPPAHAQDAIITFDNGWEDWITYHDGVQIEASDGNPDAHARYVQEDQGIGISTITNPAFVGNHAIHDSVTVGIDAKAHSVTSTLGDPAHAHLIVEFRSYALAGTSGKPYVSVWFNLALLETGQDWSTYAVTFDPSSIELPEGWGGTGATDPVTFEPMLPADISFADVMANVEEVSFHTFVPGFSFLFTRFDIGLDNLRIEKSAGESTFPRYEIVDLGDFGGELANAFDINDNGDVVGTAEEPSLIPLPYLSRGGGELIYLGSLNPPFPISSGFAQGISDDGHIAGSSYAPHPSGGAMSQAFLWTEANGMINLNPNPNVASGAWSVNSSGEVVGEISGPDGGAFIWTESEGLRTIRLPGTSGGSGGAAKDINESGQVCGHQWILSGSLTHVGWVYDSATDTYRQLPGLGGISSEAEGINSMGDVVGSSARVNNQRRPVLWTAQGDLVDLGFLPIPNFTQGKAFAINNNRWVVGSDSYDGGGVDNKGWLWIDGKKVELRTLIDDPQQAAAWNELPHAMSINNNGEIVGVGIRDGIPGRAFLMRPISDTIFASGFELEPVARH